MASLGLRSAARLLRRSISAFARKTQPTKHSTLQKHLQQDCQPNRTNTSIMAKVDEQNRLLREARKDAKFLLQRADENEAWDRLQKRVILPSIAIAALAFCAYKKLFAEPRQEMPEESKPPN